MGRILLRVIGVLCIVAASVMFFWQNIREYYTEIVNEKMITAYEKNEDKPKVNELEKWITKTEPDKLKLKANMLGYLKVPSAKINEPLLKGPATQKNLKNGVSLVEEGEKLSEQNVAIAGHRVEGAGIRFNYLDRAKVGDTVILQSRDGIKKYRIYKIFNVKPTQVGVLDEKKDALQELTLITCDNYDPQRMLFSERMIFKAKLYEENGEKVKAPQKSKIQKAA